MITLFDLSAEFWRNYFATRSDVDAYSLTIEKIQFYRAEFPQTIVVCDGPRCIRYEWYPEYKANRDAKPQDALDSLRAIKEQVASWGAPIVEVEGYEADDVIATLCEQAWPDDVQVVTGDKDLAQLISETCQLVGKRGPMRTKECIEKFGVKPHQIRDWLALVGDVADNIPGCPQTGPGRARDLLQRFETLDAILAAARADVPEKDNDVLKVRGVGKKTLDSLKAWDPSLALKLVSLLNDAPVRLNDLLANVAA